MYVCICNAVTDSEIRKAVDDGVSSLKQLRRKTGCASSCGCCQAEAMEILHDALAERREIQNLFPIVQTA